MRKRIAFCLACMFACLSFLAACARPPASPEPEPTDTSWQALYFNELKRLLDYNLEIERKRKEPDYLDDPNDYESYFLLDFFDDWSTAEDDDVPELFVSYITAGEGARELAMYTVKEGELYVVQHGMGLDGFPELYVMMDSQDRTFFSWFGPDLYGGWGELSGSEFRGLGKFERFSVGKKDSISYVSYSGEGFAPYEERIDQIIAEYIASFQAAHAVVEEAKPAPRPFSQGEDAVRKTINEWKPIVYGDLFVTSSLFGGKADYGERLTLPKRGEPIPVQALPE